LTLNILTLYALDALESYLDSSSETR
jgi:hypothetical protein